MADEPVKGPAGYLPSIGKKYGKPIAEWQALLRQRLPARHVDLVAMSKNDHGMRHGRASALVAHTLAAGKGRYRLHEVPTHRYRRELPTTMSAWAGHTNRVRVRTS